MHGSQYNIGFDSLTLVFILIPVCMDTLRSWESDEWPHPPRAEVSVCVFGESGEGRDREGRDREMGLWSNNGRWGAGLGEAKIEHHKFSRNANLVKSEFRPDWRKQCHVTTTASFPPCGLLHHITLLDDPAISKKSNSRGETETDRCTGPGTKGGLLGFRDCVWFMICPLRPHT